MYLLYNKGILTYNVEIADSLIKKTKGLMFRDESEIPDAFYMKFNKYGLKPIHTRFMNVPIDVVHLDENGYVKQVSRLSKNEKVSGFAKDVVEFPAKKYDIKIGDCIKVM